jgi:hypothetical protein
MRTRQEIEAMRDLRNRWRDTPWGHSVLLPVHDEIVAMVPALHGPAATAALVGCMQTELAGVPITADADEPSHALGRRHMTTPTTISPKVSPAMRIIESRQTRSSQVRGHFPHSHAAHRRHSSTGPG